MGKFFKIPQNKFNIRANIILAAGLILVLVGVICLAIAFSSGTTGFAFRPVILLCAGVIFIFMALAFTQNSVFIFFGIYFTLCGIVFLLTDLSLIPYGLRQMWPAMVINAGISLIPAGLYGLKRIKTVYFFPAMTLLCLGTIFLLFSMGVFPVQFSDFIELWWPVIILACGIGLIVLFFVQKTHSKDFPYMQDDSLVDASSEGDEN